MDGRTCQVEGHLKCVYNPFNLKIPVWTRRWLKCVRLKLVLLNLNLLRIVVSSARKRLLILKTLKTTCLVSLLFLLLISKRFAKNDTLIYMESPPLIVLGLFNHFLITDARDWSKISSYRIRKCFGFFAYTPFHFFANTPFKYDIKCNS